jgi:hypothetical protein
MEEEETESRRAIDTASSGTVIVGVTMKVRSGNSALGKSKRIAKRSVGSSPINGAGSDGRGGAATSSGTPGETGTAENRETEAETEG